MIVDSSFLVALFVPRDTRHKDADAVFEQHLEEQLILLDRILEETFTVLCYKQGFDFALAVKTKLETNKNITVYPLTQSEMRDVFAFAEQTKRKISVADYCVAYFAQKLQTDVLCFDKQLLSLIRKLR